MPEADRTLVTGALGCLGAWTLKALLDIGEEPVGFDLGDDDARLRARARRTSARGSTLVAGDVTDRRRSGARSTSTRSRTSSTSPRSRCRSAARSRRSARASTCSARSSSSRRSRRGSTGSPARLRELDGRLQPADPSPAPESGGTAPATLYGVFKLANEGTARVYWQDDGVAVDRDPAVRRVRAGPGPGAHLGPVARDGRRRAGRRLHDRATAEPRSTTSRPMSAAPSRSRRGRRADGAHVANFPGVPSTMQEVVAAIEAAAPAAAGKVFWEEGQLPFPESLEGTTLERLVGPSRARRSPTACERRSSTSARAPEAHALGSTRASSDSTLAQLTASSQGSHAIRLGIGCAG